MSPPRLTDLSALIRNRARAERQGATDFLRREAADLLVERIIEVNRAFTTPALVSAFPKDFAQVVPDATCVPDKETLDLAPTSHDLVVHAFGLHWADDPLGQIIQCTRTLKPDGLFLAVFLGGQTLSELRSVLAEAESLVAGGLSPRVAPMAEVRDMGGLLQRAGLAMPVADTLTLNVSYKDLYSLAHDLRGMGETNALAARLRHPTRRSLFETANQLYADHFPEPDGRIRATFELMFLTGWKPDPSQPQPLKPGSATTHLSDALKIPGED